MAKGVIYIMTTIVKGLIKIGKTQTSQYENRMRTLENNGYKNVTGLKRRFAIEVEDYERKEILLHDIFSRSRVPETELFALDVNLAEELLSSFEGKEIFPGNKSKKKVFEHAAEAVAEQRKEEGIFYLKRRISGFGVLNARMKIVGKKYIVLAGSDFCPIGNSNLTKILQERRKNAAIENNKTTRDEAFRTAGGAASFLIGKRCKAKQYWKDMNGISLAEHLSKDEDEQEEE